MAGEPDRQQLLTALTTEHFRPRRRPRADRRRELCPRLALHQRRLEHVGRARAFHLHPAHARPVEDIFYGRAINRIRHYYLELAGDQRHLFMLGAHDDAPGVLANMALRPSRWQSFFTATSMVGAINSVVGGAAVAIAVGAVSDTPLGVASAFGGVAAIASFALLRRYEISLLEAGAAGHREVLYPSPPDGGGEEAHGRP